MFFDDLSRLIEVLAVDHIPLAITDPPRVVQYCRPESSRIPLLSIGKPEVYWCKVLPSVFLEKFRSCWMRGGKSFRWKSSFSIRGRLPRQHLGHGNQA